MSGQLKKLDEHHYKVIGTDLNLEVFANVCRNFKKEGSWTVTNDGKEVDMIDTLDTLFQSIIDGGMLHLYAQV